MPASASALAPASAAQNLAGEPWERVYGAAFTGYGERSRFEQPVVRHSSRAQAPQPRKRRVPTTILSLVRDK
jgi:hypothetical protein